MRSLPPDPRYRPLGGQAALSVARHVLLLVALALAPRSAGAAPEARGEEAAEAGSELSISLLTMGPGQHPFTKFGHSAIWVHDAQEQTDEIYNYGTFAFDSPTLLLDSVAGKLPYWLSTQSLHGTLRSYREQGRSLVASELELTPEQGVALRTALRDNARPEHRYYRYDYYRDNCATRVRDVLDRALGGQIQRQTRQPARMSYRAHTLRLVADDPLLYVGLDLAIGHETDANIGFWDEGFLPQRLHDLMAQTRVTRAGQLVPLIRSETRLLTGQIAEPRAFPPNWGARYASVGFSLGAALAALGIAARRSRVARGVLAACYVALGLVFGSLGLALGYLTFFSAHSAAAANYNVLLLPPWTLALLVAGVLAWRRKQSAWRIAAWAALGACFTTSLALLIHLLSRNPQANAQELAFALPLWLGASAAALALRRAPQQGRAQPRGATVVGDVAGE